MARSQDQPVTDEHEDSYLPLAAQELRVLELYDRLQELRLEIAVLNAQRRMDSGASWESPQGGFPKAHAELLESRARYKLRSDAVESVMMAKPILEAVHNGADATPVERDLLPYIERRDEASISLAKQATAKADVHDALNSVQSDTLVATRRNVALTAELFRLSEQIDQRKTGHEEDPIVQRELAKLGDELNALRQRWRVMKGVAANIVAGSGIDWTRDEELRDMVLDPEDENSW